MPIQLIKSISVLLLSMLTLFICANAWALTSSEKSLLIQLKKQTEEEFKRESGSRYKISIKEAEINKLSLQLKDAEANFQAAKERQNNLRDLEEKEPGSVKSESLEEASSAYTSAASKRKKFAAAINTAQLELNDLQAEGKLALESANRSLSEYDAALNGVVDSMIQEKIQKVKKSQSVTQSATVPCDATPSECETRALKEAERLALDKGSLVVVDSVVEISDSRLTKDQIRSETRGTLSNRSIVEEESGCVDKKCTSYKVAINATVTPGVGPALLEEFRQASKAEIESQIGGGVNRPKYATPSASEKKPDVSAPPPRAQNNQNIDPNPFVDYSKKPSVRERKAPANPPGALVVLPIF